MQTAIQKNFNRACSTYDEHSQLQQESGRYLLGKTKPYVSPRPRCLDLGCGTGYTTQQLCRWLQPRHCTAIDSAKALLALSEARLPSTNTRCCHLDFDRPLPFPASSFDVIFSNMAVQWSTDLPALLAQTYHLLKQGGILCFSLPTTGTFNRLNARSVNDFHTRTALEAYLRTSGYSLLLSETHATDYAFQDPIAALRTLKAIGANTVKTRFPALRGKGWLNKLFIQPSKEVRLDYHISYFVARKTQ